MKKIVIKDGYWLDIVDEGVFAVTPTQKSFCACISDALDEIMQAIRKDGCSQ